MYVDTGHRKLPEPDSSSTNYLPTISILVLCVLIVKNKRSEKSLLLPCKAWLHQPGPEVKPVKDKGGKTVRFRVASANSGRVLTEVFKDETGWTRSVSHSMDSDGTSSPDTEPDTTLQSSEANSHLNVVGHPAVDETGSEPDDLLLYASAKREMFFSNKRINICSKNGTIRGVRNKVSAGQVLFNNLSSMYTGSLRHQKRRPWEKQ